MNANKILVLGKNGQVASALREQLPEAVFQGSEDLDLADVKSIAQKLAHLKPDIIINAAAYTAVDKAESEAELADKINHLAVAEIARYCKQGDCLLIHYSTDYVFDGSGNKPFAESNVENLKPVNIYGKTKLAGEKAIVNSGCEYLILRTSWIYYHAGNNFVKTMLRLGNEKEEISVVNDQVGSPTYAADIAVNTAQLLSNGIRNEIINFVPREQVSWFEFAKIIFAIAPPQKLKKINPIPSSEYKTPAKRPLNSRLETAKLNSYGIKFPTLEESVGRCIKEIWKLA